MRLAVLADSHDNLDALSYWMDYYNSVDADVLLHAGDLISPFTVPVLDDFEGPVHAVFGNNDGDRETLRDKAENKQVELHQPPVLLELSDCSVSMAHKPSDLPSEGERADLRVHGHTHDRKWSEEDSGPTINPGEVGGWLTGTSSSALVTVDETGIDYQFNLTPSP